MLRLELPHVNVLSKVDLLDKYSPLPFNLDFFQEVQDLPRLVDYLDARPDAVSLDNDGSDAGEQGETGGRSTAPVDPARQAFRNRRRRLHEAMCELVEDFGLVTFETLDIQDTESVGRLLTRIDTSNGFSLGSEL